MSQNTPPPPSYDDIARYPSLPDLSSTSMTQQYMQQQTQQSQQYQHQRSQQQPQHQKHHQQHQQGHQKLRPKMGSIPLYEDNTERRRVSELADLFSIIKATESLEAAYSRDVVSSQDYAAACARLITQFKSTESALITAGIISSAAVFFREFDVDCPRAYDRLLVSGVPATVLHGRGEVSNGQREPDSVVVAETVQAFITAIDALALENYAVDVVQPLASDLMGALNRVSSLPPDFEALVKLRLWLQKLNELRAYEELKPEEARQLKFDLESSYQAFMKHLSARP